MRALWLGLALAALVFDAVIAGLGLNGQVGDTLAAIGWGFFGTGIMGFAILGGVKLAAAGDWRGGIVAVAGYGGSTLFGVVHFAVYHHWLIAFFLALVAPTIAVLSELIWAAEQNKAEVKANALEQDERQFQRQLELMRAQAEIERQKMEDAAAAERARLEVIERERTERARLKAEHHPPLTIVQPSKTERSDKDGSVAGERSYQQVAALIATNPFISIAALSAQTGYSTGAIHNYLRGQGYVKTEAGWTNHAPDLTRSA